ncbi:MAG: hypothetical protein ON057_001323 [Glomeribacter sp. 1016415]|nr:hypothetical protein [Glomeribacter sp. 1016415]
MYRLRAVDVWDILLRRICHPGFIQLAIARYIVNQCHTEDGTG